MTKKELLDNDVFSALPDDTEIVFATGAQLSRCVPLNALNLCARMECVNVPEQSDCEFTPEYKTALVIDAIPYWYLKEKYNTTFDNEQEK